MVLKLSVARVEVLVWVLIYGGLLLFALGLALRDSDAILGHGLGVAGLAIAVAGAVLVWVRSRMVAKPPAARRPADADSSTID